MVHIYSHLAAKILKIHKTLSNSVQTLSGAYFILQFA